ncbi:gamma-glutamyltransferase [Halegenticoccus tardaugens]|uniref:gamma-glutamyltransferase n=1 Tax=Halegenticoccus tardaugens TaxID=2071624 RepID=UPI00100BCCB2|nr:gamma-glutamyltransferase [Halegenticoccus tardaugens]
MSGDSERRGDRTDESRRGDRSGESRYGGRSDESTDERAAGGAPRTKRRGFLKGSAAALGGGALIGGRARGAPGGASFDAGGADGTGVGGTSTARGRNGMVSTVHPLSTEIGADVLEAGGNAVDAAVAVQFALNVVQPHSSGIGGGGFMLVYAAEEDELYAIDNREEAPLGADPEMFLGDDGEPVPFRGRHTNGKAVGVPGTLRCCDVALKRFGTMELGELIDPSIDLADGCRRVAVDEPLAEAIADNVEAGELGETAREVFAPGGDPLEAGDPLVQPDLADTFRLIRSEGIEPFYRGEIAADIAETVQNAEGYRDEGGSMTVDDLARYNVEVTIPERATYDGAAGELTVRTMSLPSSGGLTIGQILGLLEPFDLADEGRRSVETYHAMIEAFRLAFADRGEYLGDDAFVDVPWQGYLDGEYLDERRSLVDPDETAETPVEAGDPWAYQPGEPYRVGAAGSPGDDGRNVHNRGQTTHFTVADGEGNLVSWTTTIEQLFGSGIMVPGRGFMLNNELTDFDAEPGGPNEVQPGKRPLSSTSPTVVFRDGEPYLTVGSPGGPTIITTVSQVLLGVAEFGMSLDAAVAEPRLYADAESDVLYEETLPEGIRRALEERGHGLSEESSIGSVQALEVTDDGYFGVGDYRRDSAVEGL